MREALSLAQQNTLPDPSDTCLALCVWGGGGGKTGSIEHACSCPTSRAVVGELYLAPRHASDCEPLPETHQELTLPFAQFKQVSC